MTAGSTVDAYKRATGKAIGCAVVMTVLGFLAIFLPFATHNSRKER